MTINPIKAKSIRPIKSDVIVQSMHMGEMKTESGIIIGSDDGKSHGVKPRWCKIFAIGHENTEDYNVGDWILVEHGRWTRKFPVEFEDGNVVELQKVDTDCILGIWTGSEPPSTNYIGQEYNDGASYDVDPSVFVNQ